MREESKTIKHHIDPWHTCKNMNKKIRAVAKKKDCHKLDPWIQSITNHFWWSMQTCEGNAEIIKEKWISITNHVVNRHTFEDNKHFKECNHAELGTENTRRKQWLIPGSPPHNEMVKIVHATRLLNTLPQLTECIHTTSLETYHSLYLKYLPKHTHYSYTAMEKGTKLVVLDHNHNVAREQVG